MHTFIRRHQLILILLFGIFLRIVVFIFQGPFNNDAHIEPIKYIHTHHALPATKTVGQSDHPPLYYIFASLLLPGGIKTVQSFSLLCSIGTIFIIYLLITQSGIITSVRIKRHCLLFGCTLPQFIMFGNYISNDSLSFLIGSLLFLAMFVYITTPTILNQIMLAICLGIGLLTKGIFFALAPLVIILVVVVNLKTGVGLTQTLRSILIFICIAFALGSYKGFENARRFGQPVVLNLRLDGLLDQKNTYAGIKSFYDINIFKLIQEPVVSSNTKHSYPLLLYGSFWYQYIPESDFRMNLTPFKYLGSCIYFLAVLPTILFFIGFFKILKSLPELIKNTQNNPILVNISIN